MAFGSIGSSDEEGHENSYKDLAEINIIPLVDVMLVLLIIFMLAAPLSISGVKVELPSSKAKGSNVEEQKTILSINQAGSYFIEKTQIPKDQLESKLKAIYEFRKTKEIYIRADKNVPYGDVIRAMGAAKLAGIHKIAMLTRPPLRP